MNLNLDTIEVRPVSSENQCHDVLKLRWEAYKHYFPDQEKFNCAFWQEPYDLAPNSKLFLAKKNGMPCGSTRLQIGNGSAIEIDKYINTKAMLVDKEIPYAQSSRLAISGRFPPSIIILAILKTLFLYCLKNEVGTIFFSVKQANSTLYEKLLFTDMGAAGTFIHPWHKQQNKTYSMDLKRAPEFFSNVKHPFYEFFFETDHSSSLFLN